jgi:zinc protease
LKKYFPAWLLAVLLLLPLTAHAAPPQDVLRATLPNGLRVIIVPDRLAPVVSTDLVYLAGSNDAPAGFPGTAHALEHMMFRGSTGMDKDQLAQAGALLGGNYNAETNETVTQFTYTVPSTDLDVVLRIEALRMQGLTISPADWELERGAIEQEVSRDLSSPWYTYLSRLQGILFAGTPYEHDALGTRESFDKTDAALLRRFYERWYAPNDAILVIAGDVQPQQVLAQVRAAFGAIPSRPLPAHAPINAAPVKPTRLTLSTDFPVGVVSVAYRMPGLRDADFAAADILGDVLGSQRGALYGLVPAGKALMAEYTYHPMADTGFGVAYAAFPDGGDPAPVLADVQHVLADVVRNGVPPALVAAAKRLELAQLAFRNDSISGLAHSWAQALAMQGLHSPDDVARAYRAVTVADVNRLARRLLDPSQAVVAILTPDHSGKPTGSNGYGNPESFAHPPEHPVELPPWAATALASLPKPPSPATPYVSVLPNGLRLIVEPEHVSHTVSVYGSVRQVTETEEPAGKEGVAALVGELYSYGSTKRDRLALRAAFDQIAAEESAGSFFQLKVLSAQFKPGMRLLAEHELHPAFPPEAFKVAQGQLAQSLTGLLRSPQYQFRRAERRAVVPAGDPTLRQATPETVKALTPADVTAYQAAAYRPDLTTIIVVGDVTPTEVRKVVAQTFGRWHGQGPKPVIDLPPVPPSRASQASVADPSSVQTSVALTESVTLPVTSPDRYTLILGNSILGDGFSSRLYRDLRIRTGYVYGVESALNWSRTRATYSVQFGADADKVDLARQAVLADIREMQTTPVTDAELTRAKAQVLRQLGMEDDSIPGIAGVLLHLVSLGLPLDSERIAAQRYLATTAADIQKAFATWLRPDDLAEVMKVPGR